MERPRPPRGGLWRHRARSRAGAWGPRRPWRRSCARTRVRRCGRAFLRCANSTRGRWRGSNRIRHCAPSASSHSRRGSPLARLTRGQASACRWWVSIIDSPMESCAWVTQARTDSSASTGTARTRREVNWCWGGGASTVGRCGLISWGSGCACATRRWVRRGASRNTCPPCAPRSTQRRECGEAWCWARRSTISARSTV